jgi:hypothetical protein
MRKNFPAFSAADREWKNIVGTGVPSEALLQELLQVHIGEEELLVEVNRKFGALLPTIEAAAFACSHIGEGQIQISNRDFTAFVIVAQNGVATAWCS